MRTTVSMRVPYLIQDTFELALKSERLVTMHDAAGEAQAQRQATAAIAMGLASIAAAISDLAETLALGKENKG